MFVDIKFNFELQATREQKRIEIRSNETKETREVFRTSFE